MHAIAKQALFIAVTIFVGVQFIPIHQATEMAPTNGVHMADLVDPQVGSILDRSCQDCHSGNTQWPWYSRVAPVSWMVERDVQRGRGKLDFSRWSSSRHSENERMEICDAVSNGTMPMKAYTLIHRDARLSSREVERICDWATTPEVPSLSFQPGENSTAVSQLASTSYSH
jgi:hypothetical protein